MTKNENAQMNEHNKPSQSLYSYKIRKCFDTFEIAPKIGFDIKEILNTKGGGGVGMIMLVNTNMFPIDRQEFKKHVAMWFKLET